MLLQRSICSAVSVLLTLFGYVLGLPTHVRLPWKADAAHRELRRTFVYRARACARRAQAATRVRLRSPYLYTFWVA